MKEAKDANVEIIAVRTQVLDFEYAFDALMESFQQELSRANIINIHPMKDFVNLHAPQLITKLQMISIKYQELLMLCFGNGFLYNSVNIEFIEVSNLQRLLKVCNEMVN